MTARSRSCAGGLLFFAGAMAVLCFLVHDFDHVKAALPGFRRLDLSGLETMNPLRGSYGAMVVNFLLGGAMHRQIDRLRRLPALVPAALLVGGSAALFAEWLAMTVRTEAIYDIVYNGYNCLPTLCMAAGIFLLAARLDAALAAKGRAMPAVVSCVGRNTLAVYYLHWIFGLTVMPLLSVPGCFAANLAKAMLMVLAASAMGEGMRRVPGLRFLV